MSTTLDSVVIPTFTNGLKTLDHILTKATTYAETKNIDPNTYVSARLIEDQLPLSFQVQNATKTVVTTLGRFGVPVTPFEDKEYTVEDLRARIKVALDLLASVKAGAYEKGEEGVVDVPGGGKILKITAKQAALTQGIPNFFFHAGTAFSILRAKGVPIGKGDWINNFLGLEGPGL